VGIIMGQNRCSQDEAFGILQSASNTRNMKLRDVASAIVASTGNSAPRTHFEA
jgi:AmiR/NasT family two-component response regulator